MIRTYLINTLKMILESFIISRKINAQQLYETLNVLVVLKLKKVKVSNQLLLKMNIKTIKHIYIN